MLFGMRCAEKSAPAPHGQDCPAIDFHLNPEAVRHPLLQFVMICLFSASLSGETIDDVFRAGKLTEMDATIKTAIKAGKCPGGVLWLEKNDVAYHKAYGYRNLFLKLEPMTEETIFDIASLTKVIATAPAIMKLMEDGKIDLEAPASRYVKEFQGDGRETITIRQLLTHTSGLRPSFAPGDDSVVKLGTIPKIMFEELQSTPGTTFKYSDLNFILLGEIVKRVSGKPLDVFSKTQIFRPLKMRDTMFRPPAALSSRIAPTELIENNVLRGVVHDPTAQIMGGITGHAGVFSTAADLARFARMMLKGGELDGVRILKPETVALMTSVQTPPEMAVLRGLGWDIESPFSAPKGTLFSKRESFGHTGWTGCSLWIDPTMQTFVIFLSNRNHPTESGSVVELRKTLGTLAAEALK